ncbi:MAG: FG-GAP repeat domain-containing protein [Planctomycetota bacterium]
MNAPLFNHLRRVLPVLVLPIVCALVGCTFHIHRKTCVPIPSGPPSLTLTYPNGGEIITPGTPSTSITWTSNAIATVKIELSRDDGDSWTTLVASTPAGPGQYTWTPTEGPSTNCIIRITDGTGTYSDTSDALFTIPWWKPLNPPAFTGLTGAKVAWGDYDGDGNMDFVLAGSSSASTDVPTTQLYHNNGDGTLTLVASTGIVNVDHAAVAWGDYNGDGNLDLAISGFNGTSVVTSIYTNNGDGTFTDLGAGLPGIKDGSLAWGDFNGDAHMDLALMGDDGTGAASLYVYSGDGAGAFTDITNGEMTPVFGTLAALPPPTWDFGTYDLLVTGSPDKTAASAGTVLRYSWNTGAWDSFDASGGDDIYGTAMAVGDFNNDGEFDFAVSGYDSTGTRITRVYYYNGDGGYNNSGATLLGVSNGSLAVGDYDNDGHLDLVVQGDPDGTQSDVITKVYHNNGDDTFSDTNANLPGASQGCVAFADFDNDTDLDLMVMGLDTSGAPLTKLCQNVGGTVDTPPNAPVSVSAAGGYDTVTIYWSSGGDAETPDAGLNYNIRIGTSPGANDVYSGEANTSTGKRLIPALGNGGQGAVSQFYLPYLPSGTYYYSVQAVDGAMQGGPWSAEDTFYVNAG